MEINTLAKRWVQVQRNRHDLETLLELDEHQLKDIGLRRGEIELIDWDERSAAIHRLERHGFRGSHVHRGAVQ